MTAIEGLDCESDLHKDQRTVMVLQLVYVRKGAANRWVPQNWCAACIAEEVRRRSEKG